MKSIKPVGSILKMSEMHECRGLRMTYSEQKNQFIKGQILLMSQIVAQETKGKAWKFVVTKTSILSSVMWKYRTLVFGINLILVLQSSHLNESVFLLILGLGSFGLYYCLYPPGHTLNQISTYLLWYVLPFHLHSIPKLMYTSRRDLICIEPPLEVPQMCNRVEVRWLCGSLQNIDLVILEPFWGKLPYNYVLQH